MSKENIKKILNKVYELMLEKGMSSTALKIILGAIFGIIMAFCFSNCSLHYSSHEQQFDMKIIPTVERGNK